MREHEWKSNYIRTAILLLSFVIIVVTMIPDWKSSKVKEYEKNNPFQCKTFKDFHTYKHTHIYTCTLTYLLIDI